jgi:4-oxalocrotonate tautomerase
MAEDFDAVTAAMAVYFDGLHHSDTGRLRQVFHPAATYACASEGTLLQLNMADYFGIVDRRPSPASRGQTRRDRIVSIEFAGPATAFVKAQCVIAPKSFTDFLSFVKLDGRWQIIAKVFHFELMDQSS